MKKIMLMGALLTHALLASAVGTVSDKLPANGKTAEEFVPKGWKIEQKISGDLNKDNVADVVLELRELKASSPDVDVTRKLVVLIQADKDKLVKAGVGEHVLFCPTCFGALAGGNNGEGNADIKVDKGVLIVDQLVGSREAENTIYRFRYEEKTGRMLLIGLDDKNFDRASGDATNKSINYLTGEQVDDVIKAGKHAETKKSKVTLKPTYLEDVGVTQ